MADRERRILIGTSGYSYKDWKPVFYPESLKPEMFLSYYAETFPFVELNFSYYRQPNPEMTETMVEKTGKDFLFTIKAHQSLTHDRKNNWEQEADVFKKGIAPLCEASKLGGILLQFPFSFHRTPGNRRYLAELTGRFESYPLFVEFRNTDWHVDEVYSSLLERNIGIVNTDNPELGSLPEKTALATSDKGYIRFHGRNNDAWWGGDNVSRYDYLYSEEELHGWIERIQKILEKAAVLYIAFNNHHKGQAVRNALQLRNLLAV